ncbi:MAG: hypothetical protein L0177_11790, partial [Chloroflexi bacterium]|nr:hypothetical protein [Chloroflexota bacterium]
TPSTSPRSSPKSPARTIPTIGATDHPRVVCPAKQSLALPQSWQPSLDVPVSLVLVPALEEMAHGRAITVQQFCAETLEAAIVAYRQHPAVRKQRHADLEAVRREEAMTSYSFRSSRAPAPGGSVFSPHPGNGKRP